MPDSTTSRPDEAAFWEDVAGCLPRLGRRVARYVRDVDGVDADDVVHDVVLRAFAHRHLIEPGKLLAWCSTTARTRIHEITHRGEGAHHVPVADMERTCDASGETSPDPADIVWTREVVTSVRAALQTLPAHYRTVMEAVVYRGLNQAAIADEFGMTVDQVNMIQFRARGKLRRALRPVHLSAFPAFIVGPGKALRRLFWPARIPAPAVAASTAMLVTISAVLQYAAPLGGSTPAEAATPPEVPRFAAAPAGDEIEARSGSGGKPTSSATAGPQDGPEASPTTTPPPQVPPAHHCTVMCLVPHVPTPPTDTENGDQITVIVPSPVDGYSGPVGVRQAYAPVCEHWVDNPATRCTRHGRPDWVVPPPSRSSHNF